MKLMESNPRDYGEQCRFDAFCKKVLRNEARAYLRNMKRQREREAFFSDLSQAELDKLCVMDRYPAIRAARGTAFWPHSIATKKSFWFTKTRA